MEVERNKEGYMVADLKYLLPRLVTARLLG